MRDWPTSARWVTGILALLVVGSVAADITERRGADRLEPCLFNRGVEGGYGPVLERVALTDPVLPQYRIQPVYRVGDSKERVAGSCASQAMGQLACAVMVTLDHEGYEDPGGLRPRGMPSFPYARIGLSGTASSGDDLLWLAWLGTKAASWETEFVSALEARCSRAHVVGGFIPPDDLGE